LNDLANEALLTRVRGEVEALTQKFPLYESRRVAAAKA